VTASCLVFFFSASTMHRRRTMCPFFEDDEDPKKPRPVRFARKGDGDLECDEARKDDDRDHHRHVIVRC
jgi:hypothetical protein